MSINPIYKTIILLFSVVFLNACVVTSGIQNISSISKPNFNLKSFKTYSWYQGKPTEDADFENGFNSGLDEKIQKAIEAKLQSEGFVKTSENPDLLIAYDISVQVPLEKDRPELFSEGFGYGYAFMSGYRYNYGNSGLPGYRSVDLYKSGTLLIDLIDPNSNELVWRGVKEAAISNYKARYKVVLNEVSDILNKL